MFFAYLLGDICQETFVQGKELGTEMAEEKAAQVKIEISGKKVVILV